MERTWNIESCFIWNQTIGSIWSSTVCTVWQQLSRVPVLPGKDWGHNQGPSACKVGALPLSYGLYPRGTTPATWVSGWLLLSSTPGLQQWQQTMAETSGLLMKFLASWCGAMQELGGNTHKDLPSSRPVSESGRDGSHKLRAPLELQAPPSWNGEKNKKLLRTKSSKCAWKHCKIIY